MSWTMQGEGVVTEWAVEHAYDDGERRYFSYGAWEASEEEACRAAEDAQFNAAWRQNPGGSLPVSARVVSRVVTFGAWDAS